MMKKKKYRALLKRSNCFPLIVRSGGEISKYLGEYMEQILMKNSDYSDIIT